MQECSINSLIHLQQNTFQKADFINFLTKSVLSVHTVYSISFFIFYFISHSLLCKTNLHQCSQTGFVTVDNLIALSGVACLIAGPQGLSHGRAWNLFWASVAKPVLLQLMIWLPCTLTDTTSIPMGVMYLHARMFCTLAHTSSIPMGAMYLYMQEHFSW